MATKKKTAINRGVLGSEAANKKLDQLEMRIEKIKRKFDAFFNGFEKKPPLVEFQALKREVRTLHKTGYSTATLRFKVQNMIARWQIMASLWERNMLKMERGEFKPGVGAKAGRPSSESIGRRRGIDDLKRNRRGS